MLPPFLAPSDGPKTAPGALPFTDIRRAPIKLYLPLCKPSKHAPRRGCYMPYTAKTIEITPKTAAIFTLYHIRVKV